MYPDGSNIPPAGHDSAGKKSAGSFVPLDSFGVINPSSGVWILLSVGMSNTTQEFSNFLTNMVGDMTLHPSLRIIDGAQGGQTAAKIRYDTAAFWNVIMTRLATRGLSAKQVRAIWLKEANAGPTGGFPSASIKLRDDLLEDVRVAKRKFPNLEQVFLSSRIYAGYASTALNPEPYAYESGFAVRWVIESQIGGNDSLNCNPDFGPVVAPWLAWGPYLWSDGVIPRAADSLQWFCDDLNPTDGTHPSATGRQKVSRLLEAFFKSSPYTVPWFLKSSGACCVASTGNVDCDPGNGIDISDLSRLVDYLYVSFLPLCCKEEANIDGSVDGNIDISDLSALVDYLYVSFTPPAACQ